MQSSRRTRGRSGDPADFNAPVANPYYPLRPGNVSVGPAKDGEGASRRGRPSRIAPRRSRASPVRWCATSPVTRPCSRRRPTGTPDNQGNVWYFGETTATYAPDGHVTSTEGSWKAGVHGAVAGIIMMATPRRRLLPSGVLSGTRRGSVLAGRPGAAGVRGAGRQRSRTPPARSSGRGSSPA